MTDQSRVSPAFQKLLTPGRKRATPLDRERSGPGLEVSVLFTSSTATAAALRTAGALADRLDARIRLLAPQVVPFPLPLDNPPIQVGFSEQRLHEIALASPVETTVQIYLCRDFWDTVRNVLAPRSLVVIGGRRRWWPTPEQRLAGKLRRAGYEVIYAESE